MTCFWDGLLKGLKKNEKLLNSNNIKDKYLFINFCKENCSILLDKMKYCTWNNQKLNKKEINEHIAAIKELDIKKINNGYFCSTCDSFLLLVCCLFEMNIFHNYNSITISYLYNKENEICKKNKSLFVQSDKGHFWFVSYVP